MQGFVGYSAKHNAVIAAFRGSSDIKNWIMDFDATQTTYSKCTGCKIHVGFYKSYNEVSATVKAQVQLILSKYRTAQIYVTGHSLGGALAVVAALDLKATFGHLDMFYSYGQPRVGNSAFATYFASQITGYRVVHYADMVPHLPPHSMLDYMHGGAQIWYTEDMQHYQQCVAEDPKCMDSLPPSALSGADHDLNKYLKMPTSLMQLLGLRRSW